MSYIDLDQDLGPCPECEAKGNAGRLYPTKAVNRNTGEVILLGVCSWEGKGGEGCGFKAKMFAGGLALSLECPICEVPMHQVLRNDGGKSWSCTTPQCANRGTHVADEEWNLVPAPLCLECLNPMKFWQNTKRKSYSWACFEHKCYKDCDKFGRIIHRRPSRSKGGKSM